MTIEAENAESAKTIAREHYIHHVESVEEIHDRGAEAAEICKAIKELANNETALSNFESYLARHFDKWLNKYANTPEGIAAELQSFAKIAEQ